MGKRVQYEMPAALREAQQRFEEWRNSQPGRRRPIPESLWALAAEMGRQHGVFGTAQALRLDSTKLMKRVRAAAPETRSTAMPQLTPQSAFVELITSPATAACECVIELEGPRGRMRIEWKGLRSAGSGGL